MEQTGIILRIEKISMNDGCGLRTVVFFKGCPLACAWCSTPESQSCLPEPYYRAEKCTLCGRCAAACPTGTLSVDPDRGTVVRDAERCTRCGLCAQSCPNGAQGMYGRKMTVREVMKQIHRDEVFYFHSGGGVTLSGGDILMQADFARSLLAECKDSGLDTMAELDLYGSYDRVALLLPYLDRFYVDLKLMDDALHRKWTGRSNATILENLRRAAGECGPGRIHIRVPLIWGINDSEENLRATAEFCRELQGCAALELLPYHRLGQATYTYLGRQYPLAELPAMTRETAMEKAACLKDMDLPFPVLVSGGRLE